MTDKPINGKHTKSARVEEMYTEGELVIKTELVKHSNCSSAFTTPEQTVLTCALAVEERVNHNNK